MIEIKHKADCSGCHACYNACPKNSIEMKADEEGFLYPVVNKEGCIDCGLCEKACHIIDAFSRKEIKTEAYACINNNEEIRMQSSSGGIFTLIAEKIIDRGGVVFGAAFDEGFNVRHIGIQNKEDLALFRGSKYVQSTIGNSYKEAKKFLDDGRVVLFTGTPCQTDGLLKYLKKDYDNLYVQDIICHGAPSPKVWQKYLSFVKNKFPANFKEIYFRNKKFGWLKFSVLFKGEDGSEEIVPLTEDNYMKAFLRDLSLRPSCYACHSKSYDRNSDITLADFWGIQKLDPSMHDDKGTSLCLVHTEKGRKLFSEIEADIRFKKVDLEDALKNNSPYYQSVQKPFNRRAFFKKVNENSFDKVVEKYSKLSLLERCMRKAKRELRKRLGGNRNVK